MHKILKDCSKACSLSKPAIYDIHSFTNMIFPGFYMTFDQPDYPMFLTLLISKSMSLPDVKLLIFDHQIRACLWRRIWYPDVCDQPDIPEHDVNEGVLDEA